MRKTLVIFFLLFCLFTGALAQESETTLPAQVASGDTTQTSTYLWTLSTQRGNVVFEVATDPEFSNIVHRAEAEAVDKRQPVKIFVNGLTPHTQYFYRATNSAGETAFGKFRTAAEAGQRVGVRFGATGDFRGELAPFPAVANADERDLDFFVLLGDTIAADFRSPAVPHLDQAESVVDFQDKHLEVNSARAGMNTMGDLRASTSLLATIDDHDVSNDFAGGAPPSSHPVFAVHDDYPFINEHWLFENAMLAFQEYYPIGDRFYADTGDPVNANKRRLYRNFTYGDDAAVFVLDARSFRDEALSPPADQSPEEINRFLRESLERDGRTLLSEAQMRLFKRDLRQAQEDGILWKFVFMPEPIQQLGMSKVQDRFEGYAAERNEILRFIDNNNITNVVFVVADVHGTVVNNITWQETLGGEQIPSTAFEVSVGAVSGGDPFGLKTMYRAVEEGFISREEYDAYWGKPLPEREEIVKQVLNNELQSLGYNLIGLEDSDIRAQLLQGGYTATHTYGWTEFEVVPDSGQLHVTTYGIDWYSEQDVQSNPEAIKTREPRVVSEFIVDPIQ